jgi:hypothetical protein
MLTKFLEEKLNEGDHWEVLGIDGTILKSFCGRMWTGFIWHRIGIGGRLF